MIGEKTCWQTPRENSRVNYSCHDGFNLMGPSVLICRNGTWIPDPINLMSQPVADLRTYNQLRLPMPYCQMTENLCKSLLYYSNVEKFFKKLILTFFPFFLIEVKNDSKSNLPNVFAKFNCNLLLLLLNILLFLAKINC